MSPESTIQTPSSWQSRLVAALMLAGTALSPSFIPDEAPPYPVAITAERQAQITSYLDDAVSYWDNKGVPGITDVSFTFLSGNNQTTCFVLDRKTSGSTTSYCPSGAGTVIYTAKDLDQNRSPMREVLTAGHEIGHAVQHKMNWLSVTRDPKQELGATCLLAGVYMRDRHPLLVMSSLVAGSLDGSDYYQISTDKIHGTADQQKAAFNQGFVNQDCTSFQLNPLIPL